MSRIGQASFEVAVGEGYTNLSQYGSGSGALSVANAKNGSGSWLNTGPDFPIGYAHSAAQQIQAGCWINFTNITAGDVAVLWVVHQSGVVSNRIEWNHTAQELRWFIDTTQVMAISDNAIRNLSSQWIHLSVTCKSDPVNGWFTLYINNSEVGSYTGNTGGFYTGVYACGQNAGAGWNTVYIDDLYVDTLTTDIDDPPPTVELIPYYPDAVGNNSEWTSINTVDNYLEVDDGFSIDNDSTYNFAESSGLKDLYNFPNVTIPSGFQVAAITSVIMCKKGDDGVVVNWWDDAIAAYQPKGATDLTDSLTDITGNSNDAVLQSATRWPAFSTGTGWTFDGVNDYLECATLTIGRDYTILCAYQMVSGTNDYLCGSATGAGEPFAQMKAGTSQPIRSEWGDVGTDTTNIAGAGINVAGINKDGAYLNSTFTAHVPLPTWVGHPAHTNRILTIGARNIGIKSGYINAVITAFGIWDTTLSAASIASKTTAMQAL